MEAHSTRRRWLKGSLLLGFWVLVGVLFTGQFYITASVEGDAEIAWGRMLAFQVLHWAFWSLLSLGIVGLIRRLPLERPRGQAARPAWRWQVFLLVHVPASFVLSVVHLLFSTLVVLVLQPFPTENAGFVAVFRGLSFFFILIDMLLYWAVLGVGYGLRYYQKYREGEVHTSHLEAQLAQAQLQALKMQLHPHFLFNTLNAIATLVRKSENRAATDMIAGLSDLLRMTLDREAAQEVSLEEELAFLQHYLQIEQIRFEDRLRVEMHIAPETLSARVPNLVLQPLVENAIRHGVARRAAAGLVEIRADRVNGYLRVQVRDDGPGFVTQQPDGSGVGLSNTIARLERMYGPQHRITFANAEHGGAVVTLDLPFETHGEDSDPDR